MATSDTTFMIVVIVLAVIVALLLALLIWLAVTRSPDVVPPTDLQLRGMGQDWFVSWTPSSSQGNTGGPLLYRYQVADQNGTIVQSGEGLTETRFQLLPNGQQPALNVPYTVTVIAYTPTVQSTPLIGTVTVSVVIPNPPTNLQLVPTLQVVNLQQLDSFGCTNGGAARACQLTNNMLLANENDIRAWATVPTNRACYVNRVLGSDCHNYTVIGPSQNPVCFGVTYPVGVTRSPDIENGTINAFCKPNTSSGSIWFINWTASTSPQPIFYHVTVWQGDTIVQSGSDITGTTFALEPNGQTPTPGVPYNVSVWAYNEQAESTPLTGTVQVPVIPPTPPSNLQLEGTGSVSFSFPSTFTN